MKKAVIIVAGGRGTRMGGDIPKQFLLLGKKPVIYYSISAFISYDENIRIIIGIPEGFEGKWFKICKDYSINPDYEMAPGGDTRFHTVLNALSRIDKNELVAVHDAVRPFVNRDTIRRCFQTAEEWGTAVPCIDIPDSIRAIGDKTSHPVNRQLYRMVQTPQVFKGHILKASYQQNYKPGFTDDASVVEQAGYDIHLVVGNRENFKITTAEDYKLARAYCQILSEP
jgi:2-C-methyl-D-erythritol 4-phosphate cytidylyltransferase